MSMNHEPWHPDGISETAAKSPEPAWPVRLRVTVTAHGTTDAITALKAVAAFLATNAPSGISTIACHDYEAALTINHVPPPAPPTD